MRLIGLQRVAGHANRPHVVRPHHAQREGSVRPLSAEHHALVQREESFHVGGVGLQNGEKTAGNVHALLHGELGRGVDVVVVGGGEVEHGGVQRVGGV